MTLVLAVGIAWLCPGQAISPFSEHPAPVFRGGATTTLTAEALVSVSLAQKQDFADNNDDDIAFLEILPSPDFFDFNRQCLSCIPKTARQFRRTPERVALE